MPASNHTWEPMRRTPRTIIQQDPIWHEGWFDARDGEPLWDDAHPIYRAGWLAYWRARELLKQVLGDAARLVR